MRLNHVAQAIVRLEVPFSFDWIHGSKAEIGEVGGRGLLGFTASAASGEVFAEVLAQGAGVAGANHAKNRGDLAGGFAFAHHCEGNFCRANLSRFLRRAEQEVVERLAGLRQCKEQGAFLGDLAVGLHGGRCAFGAGGGLFVGSHRINLSIVGSGRAELPFHASTMAMPCA